MVSILQEYSKYIISTDKEIENVNQILNSKSNFNSSTHKELSIYDLFRVDEFLNYGINYLDKQFYKDLVETKMFLKTEFSRFLSDEDLMKILVQSRDPIKSTSFMQMLRWNKPSDFQ